MTTFESTQSISHTVETEEQHSIAKSLALHLLPGVFILALFLRSNRDEGGLPVTVCNDSRWRNLWPGVSTLAPLLRRQKAQWQVVIGRDRAIPPTDAHLAVLRPSTVVRDCRFHHRWYNQPDQGSFSQHAALAARMVRNA